MRAIEIFEETIKTLKSDEFNALLTPALLKLGELYKSNGYDLRIVGGAVRDLLLNKEPKDIDLASDAIPEESMKMLKDANIKVIETGLQHGTITAVIDGEDFEITTLRIDIATHGRHAEVEYTKDWKIDAERRDLTFNSMSLELDGTLYDYFGGIEDLKAGKAKFVGDTDARIKEDFLRILRYFRFQGRTTKPQWDNETLSIIKQNAKGLQQISGERIWSEMGKILSGNFAVEILSRMNQSDVDREIDLPMDKLSEFKRVYNLIKTPVLLLTSLIRSEADLEKLNTRWKFSKNERELMRFVIQLRDDDLDIDEAKRLYVTSKVPNEWVRALAYYQGKPNIAAQLKSWTKPVFPITGKDMIDAGVIPGIQMGQTLQKMKDMWTGSGYELTKDELMKQVGL